MHDKSLYEGKKSFYNAFMQSHLHFLIRRLKVSPRDAWKNVRELLFKTISKSETSCPAAAYRSHRLVRYLGQPKIKCKPVMLAALMGGHAEVSGLCNPTSISQIPHFGARVGSG